MSQSSGFTLVEVAIAVVIGAILSGIALSVGVETLKSSSYTDADLVAQYEANRAFDRATEVLRKTGWNVDSSSTTYPRVIDGGAAVEFRLLTDTDGNGFPFDATTGDLEWADGLATIRLDADGQLAIENESGDVLWVCGRSIDSVLFETVAEDSALHFQEIRVTIIGSRVASDGTTVSYTATGSVHMRN